jgi:hypothetical protein
MSVHKALPRARLEKRVLKFDVGETELDMESASLIESIRRSMAIHAEMFCRILNATPRPSLLLAEALEDAGNRYLDFSESVSAATADQSGKLKSKA